MKLLPKKTCLAPHLWITNDESLIVDFLADHEEMPSDFERGHVISFYEKEDLYLVLYFSNPEDRGFQMYIVEDFSVNIDQLFCLREIFARLVREGLNAEVLKKAHYRVDSILRMAKTLRAVIYNDLADFQED
ncbi:hypothetical protein [Dyadobacter sediminis]|uniref:Uncharacterized protein n=1 Tax=Dyadobacter sediminis TaxID=1493691 RepID=A0A5R9KA31_9BACT|nr:hypothetical protein [Dyadobacter sediminis]TLU91638.1 hypothetical protein FEM55_12665 [Dyadobacter sediminis]GGC01662.1 hypothetical protein GCM10011325_31020 [Dyadobacter sediminis]